MPVCLHQKLQVSLPSLVLNNMKLSYQEYLNSNYWRLASDAVKAKAKYRCQVCNASSNLDAHHRTYENLGNELNHLDDLVCLCRTCHSMFHGKVVMPTTYSGMGMSRAQTLISPPAESFVILNAKQCKAVVNRKPIYHWCKDNGFDPTKKGWRKRLVGAKLPKSIFGDYYR